MLQFKDRTNCITASQTVLNGALRENMLTIAAIEGAKLSRQVEFDGRPKRLYKAAEKVISNGARPSLGNLLFTHTF